MNNGEKINNPFNLRATDIAWRGMIEVVNGFCCFDTIGNGLRAGFMDIYNAVIKDGFDTPNKFANHYAPPNENDTAAYAQGISLSLDMLPDDIFDCKLLDFGIAVIKQEQGSLIYSQSQLQAAVNQVLPL